MIRHKQSQRPDVGRLDSALGHSQAGWAATQLAWELPVMQEGAWVGPGTHRLGTRQQQGP